ncbi:MAG TPA: DUF1015 domain-containing protein [Polyangiaceae bacterium]|nr:DUF1015 domain-containing protein [Polyangiaceae bacterium]
MAQIAPLTPLRYDLARLPGGLKDVVCPPYDVISPEEREVLAARDPHNVVRLILPRAETAAEGDEGRYACAAALLARWRTEGVLVRDEEPAFYRCDQQFTPPGGGGRMRRRGFLALVKLVPFSERVVLPHERTLSGPKEDRLRLFRATRTNLSPGFMLYRDPARHLEAPLEHAVPLAEFTTPDGVHHSLAKVRDPESIRAIVEGLGRSNLLIADGHHRYETALRYAQEVAQGDVPSDAEPRYFMSFLVSADSPDLVVFPTHRHVHSLPAFSFDELVSRAGEWFQVEELAPGAPAGRILDAIGLASRRTDRAGHTVALAAAASDGRVVLLTLRHDVPLEAHPTLAGKPAVLRETDVTVLHAGLLEHVLGITPEAQAAKTNLWYPQNASEALAALRQGQGQVLFLLNATPAAQVRKVAEAGEVMPQKSTFFYPKVLTGLALHTLDPSRRVALFAGAR